MDSHYRSFYSLPPVITTHNNLNNNNNNPQPSRRNSAQSPWSASSQGSVDHLSLTLPSLSAGDLAEEPGLFEGLQSPSIYLPEPSLPTPQSQPPHLVATPPQLRPSSQLHVGPDSESADLFLNFEGISAPSSPVTRHASIVDLTQLSSVEMAPPSRKRKASREGSQTPSKRRPGAATTGILEVPEDKARDAPDAKVEELDMVEVDDDKKYEDFRTKQQAEIIRQQNQERADKPLKLTEFQCIICLDNPTDLTVTHCGHLFCSMCLHEALHAGTQRKTCPVCRQHINLTKNKEGKQPKNGVFVLEMKLMTARRKEKQPEGVLQ